jgi:glycine cleavage system H protein
MTNIPKNLKYAQSHEWVERLDNGAVRIGITDHAQEQLGDMVYVELPEPGQEVNAGEECAVVESVKAASDVYSPVSGTITRINDDVAANPEIVNQSPYDDGWLFEIKLSDSSELDELLDAGAYGDLADAESH